MQYMNKVFYNLRGNKGYLIASKYPKSVEQLIEYINNMRDFKGNLYNLETRLWSDEKTNIE